MARRTQTVRRRVVRTKPEPRARKIHQFPTNWEYTAYHTELVNHKDIMVGDYVIEMEYEAHNTMTDKLRCVSRVTQKHRTTDDYEEAFSYETCSIEESMSILNEFKYGKPIVDDCSITI